MSVGGRGGRGIWEGSMRGPDLLEEEDEEEDEEEEEEDGIEEVDE